MVFNRLNTKWLFLILIVLKFNTVSFGQDGKAIFIQKCASCHAIDKDLTGPALKGIEDRVKDQKLLYDWIRNNQKVIASGNKYFNDLYTKWNKTQMNLFEDLSDKDIESVLTYINTWTPPVKTTTASNEQADDNSSLNLVIGIIAFVLALISLILMQANTTLKRLVIEKQNLKPLPKIPFYKKKIFWVSLIIVLTVISTINITKSAINLGRNKDYKPEQPIYYSHKVHAGVNQINCLYCHSGAEDSKHANIPSLNVCMNCHMAINEYNGEQLIAEDGTIINGTDEIKKLYSYIGWNPNTKKYTSEAKPLEWVRIHNLPDHVYFNHSQHVKVGKVQCQTCHGEIQEMNEVYQFSSLSMGWCVNCHRESNVQFTQNNFYSLYEKFHQDMKEGKLDSVSVEKIGGLECQKCHY